MLGRSNIVGMPVAALLQQLDATVTVCHSRTPNPEAIIRDADVVVAAIGKPEFIKGAWLKPGCVVIDVGINAVDDAAAKRGYRLVGDVDYKAAKKVCSKITPVPGGVGPMTIAMLLQNTLRLAERTLARGPVVEPRVRGAAGLDKVPRPGQRVAVVLCSPNVAITSNIIELFNISDGLQDHPVEYSRKCVVVMLCNRTAERFSREERPHSVEVTGLATRHERCCTIRQSQALLQSLRRAECRVIQ